MYNLIDLLKLICIYIPTIFIKDEIYYMLQDTNIYTNKYIYTYKNNRILEHYKFSIKTLLLFNLIILNIVN
jgi:hypothetical protein